MPNMDIDTQNNRFELRQTIAASGTIGVTLETANKFVDKNIKVITETPAGEYVAEINGTATNSTVTPSVSISSANISAFGFTTTKPSGADGTNYVTIDPSASATIWSVTPKARVTQAGFVALNSSVNGSVVSNTPSIAAGTNYYIPVVTPTFDGGSFSTDSDTISVTTTPAVEITQTGTFISTSAKSTYGITETKPSGTDGTAYLSIGGSGSVQRQGVVSSSWNVSVGNVTYSNTKGVIAAHSGVLAKQIGSTSGGQDTQFNPEIDSSNIKTFYIPVVSSVAVNGGGLTPTGYTGTPTVTMGIDGSAPSGISITNTTQTSGYFVKLVGTSSALSGTTSVSRAAITYSNPAGVIKANSGANGIAADSASASVTINAGSQTSYLCIATAAASVSGTKNAITPTITRTDSSVTGATNVGTGTATTSAPSSGYFISLQATAPATTIDLTKNVSTKGYLNDATQITASASTNAVNSDVYYATVTAGIGAGNTADVAISTTDGSNNGVNIAEIVGEKAVSEPTSGYYLAFTGSGSSKVTTAGWFPTGAISNGSASATKYFPITVGTYSASATKDRNGTVTTSVGLDSSATTTYGFTTTQPTGTTGTNYLTITPNGSATATWAVTPKATIDSHGYIPAGSANGTQVTGSPSVSAGSSYYIPVITPSFEGGALTGSTTTTITPSNTITAATGTTNFYIDAAASGSVSRGAVTYSNSAGAIKKNTKTTCTLSASNSIDVGSSATRVYLKEATVTTSYSNSGMSTYFTTGTSSSKDVTITPKYTVTEGYTNAVSTAAGNGGVGYWKIKTTSVTQGTTSVSGTTATRGTASWGTGWITTNSIGAATFTNAPESGKTANSYVDISNTTSAPSITGDYLYINKGYTDDLKISLAKLIPDSASAGLTGDYILSGYSAYDNDGNLISGTIVTYEGAYTVD